MANEKIVRALMRLYLECRNDYVDEVWGRDLTYIGEAVGIPEAEIEHSFNARWHQSDDSDEAWIEAMTAKILKKVGA